MNNTIDGSKVISETHTTAETEDGRSWIWEDASYRVEPYTPWVYDGEWVEGFYV